MLGIKNVVKSFDEHQVLKDISFTVEPGKIQAILGKNGAGKTTLFRIILGIIASDSGEVLYNGNKLGLKDTKLLGFLPEERSLLKKFSIAEQLSYFAELKGLSPKDADKKIDYWLERFELSEYKHKKTKELSKGNQQKIQFISSVLHDPLIVILDEPFSGLDPFNIELFTEVILELRDRGAYVLFSSHRLDYIETFSEDIIVLVDGYDTINGKILDIKKDLDEYDVNIMGEFDDSNLEQIEHVLSVSKLANKVVVKIDDYSAVDEIFAHVREGKIQHFSVELPTLEEVIKKRAKGSLDE